MFTAVRESRLGRTGRDTFSSGEKHSGTALTLPPVRGLGEGERRDGALSHRDGTS
jgi:hypothetical protein